MDEESCSRTLRVGNLNPSATKYMLSSLFGNIGPVNVSKLERGQDNDLHALLEFDSHLLAERALFTMKGQMFLGQKMTIKWAPAPGNQPKLDTRDHYQIFVGALDPKINTYTLKDAFAPFGEISSCRIVCDPGTKRSRGYGFITFVKKSDAENAINSMNGQWLGNQSIRTNWSTRNPPHTITNNNNKGNWEVKFNNGYDQSNPHWSTRNPPPTATNNNKGNREVKSNDVYNQSNSNWSVQKTLPTLANNNRGKQEVKFDCVYDQSNPTNSTVYFGGVVEGLDEKLVNLVFSRFGYIVDIKVFQDKGCALVKFSAKDAATIAIKSVNNTKIKGYLVNCSWGKEPGDPKSAADQVAATQAVATRTVTTQVTATQTVTHIDTLRGQYSTAENQGINNWYQFVQTQGQYIQNMQAANFGRVATYGQYAEHPYQMANIAVQQMSNTNVYEMGNETGQAGSRQETLTLGSMPVDLYSMCYQNQ